MKKGFALALSCLVCMGCQSGGETQPGSAYSSAAPAAANNPVAAAATADEAIETTSGGAPSNGSTSSVSGIATAASTLGKIWKAVGFQRPAPAEPAPISPEMARFNGFVGAISTQTRELNINDPPEVTRQKAQAILTTLRDWDSVLAAGRKIGVVNDATAALLTNSVERLAAETQKLVAYAPSPETIDAVKQLGGSLGAAYSRVQGILAQGATVSQALLGSSPQ